MTNISFKNVSLEIFKDVSVEIFQTDKGMPVMVTLRDSQGLVLSVFNIQGEVKVGANRTTLIVETVLTDISSPDEQARAQKALAS